MAEEKTPSQKTPTTTSRSPAGNGRPKAKNAQSRVGGTAVPGAKSTQPKQVTSTDPQQQQMESYNRTMRRRMEQMGTAPNPNRAMDQRRKRIEKRRKRREERQQEVKKVAERGPRNITLGRNVILFLVGTIVVIVLIIVLAFLINNHIL